MTDWTANRAAGIEPNIRVAGYQGVVEEARIFRRIAHEEDFFVEDGVPAKGYAALGFAGAEALFRLEPLAVGVDQADEADLDAK